MEHDDYLSPTTSRKQGRRNLFSASPSTTPSARPTPTPTPTKRARTQASTSTRTATWRPFQAFFGRTVQLSSAAQDSETSQQQVQQQEAGNETKKDEKQRGNRPGYNTYLKVLLDNSTVSELHQTTLELKKAVDEFTSLLSEENNNQGAATAINYVADVTEQKDSSRNNASESPQPNSTGEQESMSPPVDSKNDIATTIATMERKPSADEGEEEDMTALVTNCAVTNDDTDRGTNHSLPAVDMDATRGNSKNDEATTVKKQPRRNLQVQPRSLNSLHMTLFFGGEVICNNLTAEELQAWHQAVENRLRVSNFYPAEAEGIAIVSDKDKEKEEEKDDDDDDDNIVNEINNNDPTSDLWFRISHFRTFPPRRNYLIVAVLEASPAWNALHDDLRTLASTSSCEALQEITKHSKEIWTPHITLANLRGGNRREKKELQQLLTDFSNRLHEEKRDLLVATGIGLGGPLPAQVELNWNFEYRNLPITEKESCQDSG